MLVGTITALGMAKTVCVGGTREGVAWGAPQATSSAMTTEKPSTHDNNLLAALELTVYLLRASGAGRGPHTKARHPNP